MLACQDRPGILSRNLPAVDDLLVLCLLVRLFCRAEFELMQHNMGF